MLPGVEDLQIFLVLLGDKNSGNKRTYMIG